MAEGLQKSTSAGADCQCGEIGAASTEPVDKVTLMDRPVSVRKWNGIGNGLMRAGPLPVGPVRSTPERTFSKSSTGL
jgi:hypothetical protein